MFYFSPEWSSSNVLFLTQEGRLSCVCEWCQPQRSHSSWCPWTVQKSALWTGPYHCHQGYGSNSSVAVRRIIWYWVKEKENSFCIDSKWNANPHLILTKFSCTVLFFSCALFLYLCSHSFVLTLLDLQHFSPSMWT